MNKVHDTAISYIRAGYWITPINKKVPILAGWNTTHLSESDWKELCSSKIYSFTGFGLITTPGIIVLDFDSQDAYTEFLKQAAHSIQDCPVESSGKGFHVFFKSNDTSITKQKLALAEDNSVLVEIPGQTVLSPSPYFDKTGIHTSFYKQIKGNLIDMPTKTIEETTNILNMCRLLNKAPIHVTHTKSTSSKEYFNSTVTKFNDTHNIHDTLTELGYTQSPYNSNRYICPNSKSGLYGVMIMEDNTCYSHHSSDPLNDGCKHSSFDCIRIIRFKGNYKEAFEYAESKI